MPWPIRLADREADIGRSVIEPSPKSTDAAAAAGKVALGEHGGSPGGHGFFAVAIVDDDERRAGAECCGIGRARRVGDNSAIRRPRQADLAVAAERSLIGGSGRGQAAAATFSGLTTVAAISAFCQSSVVKAFGRARLTASAPPRCARRPTARPPRRRRRAASAQRRSPGRASATGKAARRSQVVGKRRQHQRDVRTMTAAAGTSPTELIGDSSENQFGDGEHRRQPLPHHPERPTVEAERHEDHGEHGERHDHHRHERHGRQIGAEAERRNALEMIGAEYRGRRAGDQRCCREPYRVAAEAAAPASAHGRDPTAAAAAVARRRSDHAA